MESCQAEQVDHHYEITDSKEHFHLDRLQFVHGSFAPLTFKTSSTAAFQAALLTSMPPLTVFFPELLLLGFAEELLEPLILAVSSHAAHLMIL